MTVTFRFEHVRCPVCDGERTRHIGWRGGQAHHAGNGLRTEIVQCRDCSHLYPDPMPYPLAGLNELYDEPDEYFTHHDVDAKKRQGMELLREFEAVLGRRGRYLDVGCGRGEWLCAARDAGWEYEGIDASVAYLEWGRKHLDIEARLGTVEEAKFPDEHFDAITLAGVVEHLYEPRVTLTELRRVLRPGGILWLDAPNEQGLYLRAGNLYMRLLGRDWCVNLAPTFSPYHVQGFGPASLRKILSGCGFEVSHLKFFGTVCPPTGGATRRKRLEYGAALAVNWVGNKCRTGSYMAVEARRPV